MSDDTRDYLDLKEASLSKTGLRLARRRGEIAPRPKGTIYPLPHTPPIDDARHEIIESFIDERTQLIRCSCGRTTTFARERGYTGAALRARALAEFVCTGQEIGLKRAMLRGIE